MKDSKIGRLFTGDTELKVYYENENNLLRLVRLQFVALLVIAPIYTYLVYSLNIPKVYFYLGASYSIAMPLYMGMCWLIPFLRDKLIYFFIGHLFVMTILAFRSLLHNGIDSIEFTCFFALYSLTIFLIQRWYPSVLYNSFVLVLLIYGFQQVENPEMDKTLAFALFSVVAMSSVLVLYSRENMINGIEDYSEYLKNIINSPGSGYFLFDFDKNKPKLLDYNDQALRDLRLKPTVPVEIGTNIFSHFTLYDLDVILRLKFGSKFVKTIKTKSLDPQTLEIHIIVQQLKNGTYWLAKINNVTEDIKKREELELNEKKYRNLYYRNKAGVFTINRHSEILDGNASFFTMFEETVAIGQRLFTNERREDWDFVLNSLGQSESLQNYQTQFVLSNGNQKTFIFSWFLDEQADIIEASVIDLTNIQKASQAIKQSEEKYRSIFEESNDAILLLDGDQIVDVNRRGIQLFGKSESELLRTKLFDLSWDPTEETELKYSEIRKRLSNMRSVKFSWLFNGGKRMIEGEVSIIELKLEDNLYYQCVIHDQTNLNRNMRAIEQNRKNLENILENNPEGILIVHRNEILYKNSEIDVIFKEPFSLQEIFQKEDQERFDACFALHKAENKIQNIQLELAGQRNEYQQVDVTLVSTNYEDKKSTLIIIKDISVQTVLAKEKLRAELAEETNKNLEDEIAERIKAERLVQEQFLRTKAILESSSNTFLLTLLLDARISSFNSHFANYFEPLSQQKVEINLSFESFFEGIFSTVKLRYFGILFHQITQGRSHQFEVAFERGNNDVWLEIFMNPIFDTLGNVAEISIVAHDITDKKKISNEIVESLKEKEVMLKEIHHRVKNNLQIISSILNLQSSFVTDENTLEILQESRNRIRSMAIIHENLYRTEDFSSINFADYLMNLVTNLIASYRINDDVQLKMDLDQIDLVLDQAIPCGLLVNELITNSLKYAWPEHQNGLINLGLKEVEGEIILTIGDNGVGLPVPFEVLNSDTLGLQLVVTLVEQLDGKLVVNSENGTEYLVKFDNIKTRSNGKD